MFPDLKVVNLQIVTETPFDVVEEPTVWIPVADDIRLAARVWRPPFPLPVARTAFLPEMLWMTIRQPACAQTRFILSKSFLEKFIA